MFMRTTLYSPWLAGHPEAQSELSAQQVVVAVQPDKAHSLTEETQKIAGKWTSVVACKHVEDDSNY
jgi:hypothetical protein